VPSPAHDFMGWSRLSPGTNAKAAALQTLRATAFCYATDARRYGATQDELLKTRYSGLKLQGKRYRTTGVDLETSSKVQAGNTRYAANAL
jgi:hypothetical protein